ncbi:hypothetical protein TeGR_g2835 [Tetraparma gracilis]|uniref:Uncharacterized protein n=1 Tax=Tetraparma gracilis TaxID=2962635 RepID=A0ABQ6MVN9_9STRA|nr:hypothetical protein TeGR_g2835 [Tetraparma gracilis]
MGIKVWSKCEYEYWASSYVKGKNRADDDHMCADANPLVGAMETSSSCYTPVLDNIFDGVDFGGAQYVYEEPLTQMVHIPCLSFDPDGNGCANNPCEGLALEDE